MVMLLCIGNKRVDGSWARRIVEDLVVALSSTETSPDVSGILGIVKAETKGKIVLGEFLYIRDMRQRNLGNVK